MISEYSLLANTCKFVGANFFLKSTEGSGITPYTTSWSVAALTGALSTPILSFASRKILGEDSKESRSQESALKRNCKELAILLLHNAIVITGLKSACFLGLTAPISTINIVALSLFTSPLWSNPSHFIGGAQRVLIENLALKYFLGAAYSVSHPIAALTGAIALPLIHLINEKCFGKKIRTEVKKFGCLLIHNAIFMTTLKVVALFGFMNPLSIESALALSVMSTVTLGQVTTSFQGGLLFGLANLVVGAVSPNLGATSLISLPAAGLVGAVALPIIDLLSEYCRKREIGSNNPVLTEIIIHNAVVITGLVGASFLTLMNPASISNIVALSLFTCTPLLPTLLPRFCRVLEKNYETTEVSLQT